MTRNASSQINLVIFTHNSEVLTDTRSPLNNEIGRNLRRFLGYGRFSIDPLQPY